MTSADSNIDQLTDEQLRDAEQAIANQKREREYAKWDAEIVGRYFRIIRTPTHGMTAFLRDITGLSDDGYVTLEESLAVGNGNGKENRYVYADVVYLHIRSRDGGELTCSGFEVSNDSRKETYLKIQPTFHSWSDFRYYLNSQSLGRATGPTKHFDEISKEGYAEALNKAVVSATEHIRESNGVVE